MLLRHKLGVSMMIGYVLLITFAMITGTVVYTWLKSYVPTEALECPDGVSVFMKDVVCNNIGNGKYNLSVELVNNGRFAIDGYYIKYTTNENQTIGIKPITKILSGGQYAEGLIFFPGQSLEPSSSLTAVFELSEKAYLIDITPMRYEIIEGRNRIAVCGGAKIKENINCG